MSNREASHGARKCNTPRCFSLAYMCRMHLIDQGARSLRAPRLVHFFGSTACGDSSPISPVLSSRRLVKLQQCLNSLHHPRSRVSSVLIPLALYSCLTVIEMLALCAAHILVMVLELARSRMNDIVRFFSSAWRMSELSKHGI